MPISASRTETRPATSYHSARSWGSPPSPSLSPARWGSPGTRASTDQRYQRMTSSLPGGPAWLRTPARLKRLLNDEQSSTDCSLCSPTPGVNGPTHKIPAGCGGKSCWKIRDPNRRITDRPNGLLLNRRAPDACAEVVFEGAGAVIAQVIARHVERH